MEVFSLQELPYLIMGMLWLWNGFLFTFFHSRFPHGWLDAKGYLFFGLCSLALAGFALGSIGYLCGPTELGFRIITVRGSCLALSAIFLFLFSASYLKIKNWFWWISPPLIGGAFALLFLFPGIMLSRIPFRYEDHLRGIPIVQTIWEVTLLGRLFIAWAYGYAIIHYVLWIKFYYKSRDSLLMVLGYTFFILVGLYQVGIQNNWYRGPALLDFGFFGMLAVISFRLFRQVVGLNKAYSLKSQALQKANEEIRFLLRAISHDVVGPLVSIHGFADLLVKEEAPFNQKQNHYLERIQTNVDHMNSLLDGISEYLMADPAKTKLNYINCQQVLKETLTEILNEKTIPLKIRPNIKVLGEWPQNLRFSKDYFKYLLTHLIENGAIHGRKPSRKAQPANITLEGKVDQGAFQISVMDEGPGIPLELQQKVFDINYLKDRGALVTGLGLPTIKKIVGNFSGQVWVDPNYTRGACIRVMLPYEPSSLAQSSKIKLADLATV